MSRNTLYLLGMWSFVLFVLLWLTVPAMIVLGPGHPYPSLVLGGFVVLAFAVFRWGTKIGDWKIRRELRSDSPEMIVAWLKRSTRFTFVPDKDAIVAHGCALVYILYADFDAARATVKAIDWERRAPLIRAMKHSLGALLCYLEAGRYETGLEFARAARDMGRISGVFPGSRMSADAFEAYVEIGEILCGDSTDEKVASLERKQATLPTLGKLPIAWALAVAYDKRGDRAKAEAARQFIRDVAPHCRAITSL